MQNKKIKVDYPFFKVVADGGMMLPIIGEGRLVPAIMIDIEDNIEVSELLKLHDTTPPGDTELFWSLPSTFFSKPKFVYLNLTFLKPMEITFGIEFSLHNRTAVIDAIIHARAFYLQVGISGEKVTTLFMSDLKEQTKGCILIEVPNMNFDTTWNSLLIDTIKQRYKKQGVTRKELTKYTQDHIKKMREIWNIRKSNG